jgi:hypothetical protein
MRVIVVHVNGLRDCPLTLGEVRLGVLRLSGGQLEDVLGVFVKLVPQIDISCVQIA